MGVTEYCANRSAVYTEKAGGTWRIILLVQFSCFALHFNPLHLNQYTCHGVVWEREDGDAMAASFNKGIR